MPRQAYTTGMTRTFIVLAVSLALSAGVDAQNRYRSAADGRLRIALAQQPLGPNGPSKGPDTMAGGGIQKILTDLGATVRVEKAQLTPLEETEYGGWKKLGMSLGHFADIVTKNEKDGYFTVGLLATCPSMPGLVAGLQNSGSTIEPIRVGMLWLDAHPDFNTPETTRSGSLGGMPVAVATGRALHGMRRDARLDPPMSDQNIVMAGVRLTDPLEQRLLDDSRIEQLSVDDLRNMTPAVWQQLDRLNRIGDNDQNLNGLSRATTESHAWKTPLPPRNIRRDSRTISEQGKQSVQKRAASHQDHCAIHF